jgi:hypothetical protein
VEVAIFVQLDLAPLGKIAAGLARFFSPAQWAATRVELEDVEEFAALFLLQVEIFVQFVLEPPLRTGLVWRDLLLRLRRSRCLSCCRSALFCYRTIARWCMLDCRRNGLFDVTPVLPAQD